MTNLKNKLAELCEIESGKKVWVCWRTECSHTSEFMTVAIFHQHDEHEVPMEDIVLEENRLMRKEKS